MDVLAVVKHGHVMYKPVSQLGGVRIDVVSNDDLLKKK